MAHVPMRTCMGCGQTRGKQALLRVVRMKSGEVVPDPTGRQPGRGAYLCYDTRCLTLASKKNSVNRSLKVAVSPQAWDAIADAIIMHFRDDDVLKPQSTPTRDELSRALADDV